MMEEKLFNIVSKPWVLLLDWLVKLTGQRSTFFARHAAIIAAVLSLYEVYQEVRDRDDWWLLGAVIWVILVAIYVPWALRTIDKLDKFLQSGAGVFPLTYQSVSGCRFWTLVYTTYSVLTLPLLITEEWILPVRCMVIACTTTWIITPRGGGKSVFARIKERLRQRQPQPVLQGGTLIVSKGE